MLKEVNSFWGHIAELTKRMKIVLVVFIVSLFVMLVLPATSDFFAMTSSYKPLMSVVLNYISVMFLPPNAQLFAGSMSDPITLYVYAALVFAVVFTMPVFAYQAVKFIAPALYDHEKKMLLPYVTSITALFITGALFGFFFLAPAFIQGFFPFYNAVGALPYVPIMDFYNIIFFTVLVSGFLFIIPVFFVILVKFNIIQTKMVSGKRKWIYLGIIIAAMLISPGSTPMGDLILFIAVATLFELSILVGKIFEAKRPDASEPKLLAWFASTKTCSYCHSSVDSGFDFCPKCRRAMK
jgi:sec-independent protein translocase protein TatC